MLNMLLRGSRFVPSKVLRRWASLCVLLYWAKRLSMMLRWLWSWELTYPTTTETNGELARVLVKSHCFQVYWLTCSGGNGHGEKFCCGTRGFYRLRCGSGHLGLEWFGCWSCGRDV